MNTPWSTNAELPGRYVRKELPLPGGMDVIDSALRTGALSERGVDKVLKVAWTVADLQQATRPAKDHLLIALALRQGQEAAS
jgi:magnesium chelatase family protein